MASLSVGDKLVAQHDFRIFTIPGVADSAFNPSAVPTAKLFKEADDAIRGRFRNPLRLSEGERAALTAAQVCLGQVIEEGTRGTPERAPHG